MIKIKKAFGYFGPGFIIAATGIGAGDMVTATVAGANYGMGILWAVVVGAVLKYYLNEGVARWQLSTGSSILEGWMAKIHPMASYYFLGYLFLWSFIVAGALMAACGLAAHSIFPFFSVKVWGIVHSILALSLVLWGSYKHLETIMKAFICLMFLTIIFNLFLADIDWAQAILSLFTPVVPTGSVKFILGMIGGVGGSVTLLSYGYWLKEKGWKGTKSIKRSRIDLGIAYLFTGLFGFALVILSADLNPEKLSGNQMVISLSEKISETTGSLGQWIFLLGFWGAVFSSMLGVWSGIPYIFNEFVAIKKQTLPTSQKTTKSSHYRWFLTYMAIPPMVLLFLDRPVWVIIIYSIAGAFFMPFLAATLLYLNNKIKWVSHHKNSHATNLVLLGTLLVFLYLLFSRIME